MNKNDATCSRLYSLKMYYNESKHNKKYFITMIHEKKLCNFTVSENITLFYRVMKNIFLRFFVMRETFYKFTFILQKVKELLNIHWILLRDLVLLSDRLTLSYF